MLQSLRRITIVKNRERNRKTKCVCDTECFNEGVILPEQIKAIYCICDPGW